MTLPDERLRALHAAKEFLRALLDPKQTPRVPRAVRQRAHSTLKHFPATHELDKLPKALPKLFGET